MKNLILSVASLAIISLSSFTRTSENSHYEDLGTISCKWRTVYYHANGNVSYTQWTYGNCNQSEDGTLHPIR